ncbi:unnamed protein product [Peniophora sp. CBMAI 1063]|nr:unnamed protein product [Peniophora sp. CBMAI 1063]
MQQIPLNSAYSSGAVTCTITTFLTGILLAKIQDPRASARGARRRVGTAFMPVGRLYGLKVLLYVVVLLATCI